MGKYEILKNLVKVNTIKDKGNREIINYIEKYLRELGFKTEYKTKALIMSIGKEPKLGFLGHTDTVEYVEEFKNPFELTIKDGLIYGLGVCDMKGGIAAFLDAVNLIELNKLKSGLKLYFTYDEEINFDGIYELVKNKEKFPKYMIFGEPTNNEIYTGHKGLMEYRVSFKGKKAHSSLPSKGISANMNAVRFLYELEQFYNNEIKTQKENAFSIPYTTMNVGLINGGTAINSISSFCNVALDFRIIKQEHIDVINKKINELAKTYKADAKQTIVIEPFLDNVEFLVETKTADYMTEASMVKNSKRIILGTGPVTAHEVNEHISENSYEKLINQYIELIYKICNGGEKNEKI